jgi:hypothetical protein
MKWNEDLLLAMLIWGCAVVAVWDAVSAYRRSDHIRKLMARRWHDED